MPNVDPEHFLPNIRVFLFADFSAVTFILQALSPITLISLQPGLQYSLNITLKSFRVFWTGLHFEYYLKTCDVLKTWCSLMKQKLEMLCIATAAHIYGDIYSYKYFSWLINYSSLFLSSKKHEKDENKIRTCFNKILFSVYIRI